MKVKILTVLRGSSFAHNPGDIVDMLADRARMLIEKGAAELLEAVDLVEDVAEAVVDAVEETADADSSETAEAPKPRRGRRK